VGFWWTFFLVFGEVFVWKVFGVLGGGGGLFWEVGLVAEWWRVFWDFSGGGGVGVTGHLKIADLAPLSRLSSPRLENRDPPPIRTNKRERPPS